jgi:excinuclease ABC subunit C
MVNFFTGNIDPIVAQLEEKMATASKALDFERAARFRDELTAVHEAAKTQELVLADDEDLDVVGVRSDELQVAAVAVHIRHGRIVGKSVSVADLVEDLDEADLCATVLRDLYGDPSIEIPPTVALSVELDDGALAAWLRDRRGSSVRLRVPKRGSRRRLVELAELNAAETLARDRMHRANDHNARSRALLELQELLGLERVPFRIECYDMSHLQGSSYVGSMVVFEDGVPVKKAYRHFSIKTVQGSDDVAAMTEVLRRRLLRWSEAAKTADGKRSFAAPADLLLIDGGLGQLNAVTEVVRELGLESVVELASLAKRFEEIYRPGRSEPIRLARGSEALFLLQRIRDEAHRFAISFHRSTRGRAMTAGAFDGVPGLGPGRQARLIERFGSVQALRGMQREELEAEHWLPKAVADALFEHLHPRRILDSSASRRNTAESEHG